jgi:hypothetical protein
MSPSIVVVLTRVISTQSKTPRCSKCGSSKTKLCYRNPVVGVDTDSIITRKYQNWCKGMCMKCYNRIISNPKHNPIGNPRRIRFKDKRYLLKESPRIGVCNTCRAVAPFDCKLTHMNHFAYDIRDPLRHTLEQCNSCHRRYHNKNWR